MRSIAVIGASLAGLRTAEALREAGFEGRITVFGDEPHLPYDRPPLSKGYLSGRDDRDRITLRTAASLAADSIDVRVGDRVDALTVTATGVAVDVGATTFESDGAVIATGARTRRAPFPVEHPNAHEIRRVDDADRLRPHLVDGARVAVIGAGFIGAEVASTARAAGCDVTIIEAAPVPLSRQLGDAMGAACAALHERNGVRLLTAATVARLSPDGVVLGDGAVVPADVVVVGIGVQPNTEWLDGSGLEVRDGVCADSTLRVRTSGGAVLDHVVAVGDVVRWTNPLFDEEMRVEHWTNAAETATHAAASLLGAREAFCPVPYFWSDQYGRKIQFVGRATGFDEVQVVQGNVDEDSFLALYRRDERLVAALGLHKMRAVIQMRGLVLAKAPFAEALALATA